MTFWERIVGSSEGTSIGSILGRLSDVEPGNTSAGPSPHTHVAFTIAVVALGAKMAKADGRVTPEEVAAFKEVFTVAPKDMTNVGRVFDLARQDTAGFEVYADQLARLFAGNKPLLRDVLEGLFHIATADTVLHPAEDQFLAEVARRFGFSDSDYAYVRAHFVETGETDPYHVLSLAPSAGIAEIRAQYRQLVSENHPDRYIARGLPKEVIEIANRKLAAINAAYEVIARERGFK